MNNLICEINEWVENTVPPHCPGRFPSCDARLYGVININLDKSEELLNHIEEFRWDKDPGKTAERVDSGLVPLS